MIGLEYICNLSGMTYSDVARELGISKQMVNNWIKGRKPISTKHIPKLSELFNMPSEFFQLQLSDLDKLMIDRHKFRNSMMSFESESLVTDIRTGEEILISTEDYNSSDISNLIYMDYEVDVEILKKKIGKSLDNKLCLAQQREECSYDGGVFEARKLLEIYNYVVKIIEEGIIEEDTLRSILIGVIRCEDKKVITDESFSGKISELVRKEKKRLQEIKLEDEDLFDN